jgi:hypothetical protein
MRATFGLPSIHIKDYAATLLDQMVREGGVVKDTLENAELETIGKAIWESRGMEWKS